MSVFRLLQKSAKTAPANLASDVMTADPFIQAMKEGVQELIQKEWKEPFEGERLVRQVKTDKLYGRFAEMRGYAGTVPANRDEERLPYSTTGFGFSWDYLCHTFRRGISVSRLRADTERDFVGNVRSAHRDLLNMGKRTVEQLIAWHVNTFIGSATGGSARLASDGCYWIDENRPQPNPEAGTWSNLEAPGSLTEDLLADAVLNAATTPSPDGYLHPLKIKKIIIPPSQQVRMWKLLNSDKVLGSNYNDANWASSAFEMGNVMAYSYMTTNQILYMTADSDSEDNEFVMFVHTPPSIEQWWGRGDNPDIFNLRIRFVIGFGMGDPRRCWRGGLLV